MASADMQWLFYSGEQIVAHGPLDFYLALIKNGYIPMNCIYCNKCPSLINAPPIFYVGKNVQMPPKMDLKRTQMCIFTKHLSQSIFLGLVNCRVSGFYDNKYGMSCFSFHCLLVVTELKAS